MKSIAVFAMVSLLLLSELFDLAVGPGETTDLAAANPELMAQLAAADERHAADVGVIATGPPAGAQ